jgi:hypothetical protein
MPATHSEETAMAAPATEAPKDDPNDDFDPGFDVNQDGKHDATENQARADMKKAHEDGNVPGSHTVPGASEAPPPSADSSEPAAPAA